MTEYIRGLKAGIVSGLIFGIANAIVASLIFWFMLESIPGEMSEGLIKVGTYILTLLIRDKIIFGIIGGVIFGLIFSIFYNKLPGSKPIVNGIATAIIYWVIFSVFIGNFSKGYYISYYGTSYGADLFIGLIMYLFWGFLLIKFWQKFGEKEKVA